MSNNVSFKYEKNPFILMFEMRFTQKNVLQTFRYKEQQTTHGTFKNPKVDTINALFKFLNRLPRKILLGFL